MLDIRILSHFTVEKNEFVVLKLKPDEIDVFLDKLPVEYRKCYITDDHLVASVRELNMHYSDLLKDHYLPDPGNVMSGEFGEILSYFLLKERYIPEKELDGPKKWLWKDDRNHAIQKTDVMLFSYDGTPSTDDLMVSGEIKAKATKNNRYDPIKNAVDGAHEDFVSRLSVSLAWLKSRYVKERDGEQLARVERFLDPVTYGTYHKHFKAVVVIDDALLAEEVARERSLVALPAEFEILLISIQGLKSAYERTYRNVRTSGSDLF